MMTTTSILKEYDVAKTRLEVLDYVEQQEAKVVADGKEIAEADEDHIIMTKKKKGGTTKRKKKTTKKTIKNSEAEAEKDVMDGKTKNNNNNTKKKTRSTSIHSIETLSDADNTRNDGDGGDILSSSERSRINKANNRTYVQQQQDLSSIDTGDSGFVVEDPDDKPKKKKKKKKKKKQQQRSSQIVQDLPTELNIQMSSDVITEPGEVVVVPETYLTPAVSVSASASGSTVMTSSTVSSTINEQQDNDNVEKKHKRKTRTTSSSGSGGKQRQASTTTAKTKKKKKEGSDDTTKVRRTRTGSNIDDSGRKGRPSGVGRRRQQSSTVSSTATTTTSEGIRSDETTTSSQAPSLPQLNRHTNHTLARPGMYAMDGPNAYNNDYDEDEDEINNNRRTDDDQNNGENLPVALPAELVPEQNGNNDNTADGGGRNSGFDPRTMVVMATNFDDEPTSNNNQGGGLSSKTTYGLIIILFLFLICGTAVGFAFAFSGNNVSSSTDSGDNDDGQTNNDNLTNGPPTTTESPNTATGSTGNPSTIDATTDPPTLSPVIGNSGGTPSSIDTSTTEPTNAPVLPIEEVGETCGCYQYQQRLDSFEGETVDLLDSENINAFGKYIALLAKEQELGPSVAQQGHNIQSGGRERRNLLRSSVQRQRQRQRQQQVEVVEENSYNIHDGVQIISAFQFWGQQDFMGFANYYLILTYRLSYCVSDPRILQPDEYVSVIHENFMDWMSNSDNKDILFEGLTDAGAIPYAERLASPDQQISCN